MIFTESIGLYVRSKALTAGAEKFAAASELDHQIHPTVMDSTVLDALNSVNIHRNPIYYPSANPVGLENAHFAA